MHRFFIPQNSLNSQKFASTDKDLCHQVSKVLKMRVGQKIIFCDNTEHDYLAKWTTVSKSLCEAKIDQKTYRPDISTIRSVHLFVPPLKNQNRYELILEKCTEIGAASFTPLITERTEVFELRKPERLQKIIKEAAEVSGRTKLPKINPTIKFEEILSITKKSKIQNSKPKILQSDLDFELRALNLVATLHKPSKALSSIDTQNKPLNLYIGPVGDFTEEEVKKAVELNFYPVSLGSQVLRTETAAIVACSNILATSTSSPSPSYS